MTRERLEEIAAGAIGENAEIYALARRGLVVERWMREADEAIATVAALRRACELAREFVRIHPDERDMDDVGIALCAALAAVGFPVEEKS